MLKKSNDIDILSVTFDYKMTFEEHLRSVYRSAAQRLGSWRKSWRISNDRLSNIGVLVRLLAAELSVSQDLYVSVLVSLWNDLDMSNAERAGPMLFYWPKLLPNFWSSTAFNFPSFFLRVVL